jgi:hypothetical protein
MPAAIPGHMTNGGGSYVMAGTEQVSDPTAMSGKSVVIDGTPSRVAALGIAAVAVLIGLRWSGLRFNVAVGNR